MAFRINTNISAINTRRQLDNIDKMTSKTLGKNGFFYYCCR